MQTSKKVASSVNEPQKKQQDSPSYIKQNDQETKGQIKFNIDKCEAKHLEKSLYSK